MALMAACFFCCSFVFNGSIVNATAVSGNKYLNVSAMLLVSIPTRLLSAVTLTRFGRKGPICVAYLLCAIFFVTSAFVPKCELVLCLFVWNFKLLTKCYVKSVSEI